MRTRISIVVQRELQNGNALCNGWVDRFAFAYVLSFQLSDTRDAEKAEAFDDLGLQQLEDADDTVASSSDQSVAVNSADRRPYRRRVPAP